MQRKAAVVLASGLLALQACQVSFVEPEEGRTPAMFATRVWYSHAEDACLSGTATLLPGSQRGVERPLGDPPLVAGRDSIAPLGDTEPGLLRYRFDAPCGPGAPGFDVMPPGVDGVAWPRTTIRLPLLWRWGSREVAVDRDEEVRLSLAGAGVALWGDAYSATRWTLLIEPVDPEAGDWSWEPGGTGRPPNQLLFGPGALDGAPAGPLRARLQIDAVGSIDSVDADGSGSGASGIIDLSMRGRVEWILTDAGSIADVGSGADAGEPSREEG